MSIKFLSYYFFFHKFIHIFLNNILIDLGFFDIGEDGLLIDGDDEHPGHVMVGEFSEELVSLLMISIFHGCDL